MRPRPRAGRVVPRALARGRGERPAPRVELGPRRDRASVRRVAGHAPQVRRARVGGRVRRRNRKRALRGFARGLVHRGGAHAHRRVAFFRVRRGGRDPLVRARDGAHERGRLVDRAVARANAFSDAQVRAFGEACAQSRWCAVNKLSGDEVRTRSRFGVFSAVVGTFSKAVSVVGTFSWPQEHAPRRRRRGLTRERRVNFFRDCAPRLFPKFLCLFFIRDPL